MPAVLLPRAVRGHVAVVRPRHLALLERLLGHAREVVDGLRGQVADELVEVNDLPVGRRVAQEGRRLLPLLVGRHHGGVERHLRFRPRRAEGRVRAVLVPQPRAERAQGRVAVVVALRPPGPPHLPLGGIAAVEDDAEDAVGVGGAAQVGDEAAQVLAHLPPPQFRGDGRRPPPSVREQRALLRVHLLPPARGRHADVRDEVGLRHGVQHRREVAVKQPVVVHARLNLPQVPRRRGAEPVHVQRDARRRHLAVQCAALAPVVQEGDQRLGLVVDEQRRRAAVVGDARHRRDRRAHARVGDRHGRGRRLAVQLQDLAHQRVVAAEGVGGDGEFMRHGHAVGLQVHPLRVHLYRRGAGHEPQQDGAVGEFRRGLGAAGELRADGPARDRLTRRGQGRLRRRPARLGVQTQRAGRLRGQRYVVHDNPAVGLVARVEAEAVNALAHPAPLPRVLDHARLGPRGLPQVGPVDRPAPVNGQRAPQTPAPIPALVVDIQHIRLRRGVDARGQVRQPRHVQALLGQA